MTDDPITLASSYLDGEVTADERARVEDSSELLAEVERLRQVRAVIATDEPAAISTRERQLAAALDVWDRLPSHDDTAETTPPGTAPLRQTAAARPTSLSARRSARRGMSRGLMAVAAALIVVAGAGIVINFATGTSDDSSADSNESADVAAAPAPAENDAGDGAGEPAAAETADELATAADSEQAPPELDLAVLASADDLSDYALGYAIALNEGKAIEESTEPSADTDTADASAATVAPTLAPPVDLCDLVDAYVGPARWVGYDEPIAVGVDVSTDTVVAYDPATCQVIATVPVPNS